LTVAKTSDIVFVTTEVFLFCGSAEVRLLLLQVEGGLLELERAELLVDNLPDDLVRRHGDQISIT